MTEKIRQLEAKRLARTKAPRKSRAHNTLLAARDYGTEAMARYRPRTAAP